MAIGKSEESHSVFPLWPGKPLLLASPCILEILGIMYAESDLESELFILQRL